MGTERIRIGDMLVAAGFVTEEQVQQALAGQKQSGRRLGEELVESGFVNEVQLTQILSNQLSVPWVSLYHIEFSRELLNLVPRDVAQKYCLIPIYVRKVRRAGDTLFVAMDDPTNEEALERVRETAQLPVKAMVAPPTEVRNAIRVYYFGGKPKPAAEPAAKSEGVSETASASEAATETASATETETETETGTATETGTEGAPPAPPEPEGQVSKPPPARKGPPMMTLTLLDGTEVRLPSRARRKAAEPEAEQSRDDQSGALTANDLVSALLARAQGQDVSDLLPDDNWETLFATLLTLLMRKGLIADWEFVEEWRKRQGESE